MGRRLRVNSYGWGEEKGETTMDGEKVRGNSYGWGVGKGEQLWMGRR
jgi:hypothetical protein